MTRTTVILALTAAGLIIGLGVLARISPDFKAAATDVGVTALIVLVMVGLLGALIAPLLDLWTESETRNRDNGSDRADEPTRTGPASHTGGLR
jgi:hypothetical protein